MRRIGQYALARAGRRREALEIVDKLSARSTERYVSPWGIAGIYAGLGDKDRTLQWLEQAYLEKTDKLVELKVEPIFDDLRSDPRFADLLRRVGLP